MIGLVSPCLTAWVAIPSRVKRAATVAAGVAGRARPADRTVNSLE